MLNLFDSLLILQSIFVPVFRRIYEDLHLPRFKPARISQLMKRGPAADAAPAADAMPAEAAAVPALGRTDSAAA